MLHHQLTINAFATRITGYKKILHIVAPTSCSQNHNTMRELAKLPEQTLAQCFRPAFSS